jgi:hypothetical protein
LYCDSKMQTYWARYVSIRRVNFLSPKNEKAPPLPQRPVQKPPRIIMCYTYEVNISSNSHLIPAHSLVTSSSVCETTCVAQQCTARDGVQFRNESLFTCWSTTWNARWIFWNRPPTISKRKNLFFQIFF